MMGGNISINNLQKRNNSLRSLLVRNQLKYGTYPFGQFKKYLLVISEYRKFKSFFKVASSVGVSQRELMSWYVRGQLGDPKFRVFYLAINDINNNKTITLHNNVPDDDIKVDVEDDAVPEEPASEDDAVPEEPANEDEGYIISQYGDGWSYKTFIDGEKIFLISNDLDNLKKKVKAKHLPLD